ncbi:DNA primase [Bacillus sp. T33-2]|nr:DNA primase [Bacillus sp. T33-2]
MHGGSRSKRRAKRRKTNLVLNSLIVIVILLIVFVSMRIFFTGDEGAADNKTAVSENKKTGTEKSESKKKSGSQNKKNNDDNTENGQSGTDGEDVVETEPSDETESGDDSENSEPPNEGETAEPSEPVVTEGGSDPNVKRTIVNPDWKPVGTTQTGEHAAVYDESSVDWQEMLQAISYASGLDKNNMTVWRLGNNGGPNSAIGTVSQKGSDQKYRVAIEWVDGQGWKPVKVEELH